MTAMPNFFLKSISQPTLFKTAAYSHEFFVRGQRYLCEFMERRKQGLRQFSKAAKASKPMESKSSSEPTPSSIQGLCMSPTMLQMEAPMSNAASTNNLPPSAPLMASNKLSLDPIGITASATREEMATENIYQAFMNQEWEGLPFDVTPRDVVSEIIETFRAAA